MKTKTMRFFAGEPPPMLCWDTAVSAEIPGVWKRARWRELRRPFSMRWLRGSYFCVVYFSCFLFHRYWGPRGDNHHHHPRAHPLFASVDVGP